jgi:hypothetical protein
MSRSALLQQPAMIFMRLARQDETASGFAHTSDRRAKRWPDIADASTARVINKVKDL